MGRAPEIESAYAHEVKVSGLGASHMAILEEVDPGTRVLDVGCATGYLAELLTARGCTVVGFERDARAAAEAERHVSEIVVGDVESPADRERIPGAFDAILFGDVLEHLLDPWGTLASVRGLLAPHGVVIASIPNVAAWTVRIPLLRGSFEYSDTGLLDRTHLRFFTRRSARELALRAGYEIERERWTPLDPVPDPIRRVLPRRAAKPAIAALARWWPELFALQFVLRLRPRG